ncbi:MAG: prohibitin family protein [Schleiferiaceae bacterium]|jgi:prohibitin 1|nr:prohibitin family protein [Schleiferiaceae bacterium]MDP4759384.1 prohibitin family protein [Schleiferiaceae bacterium]MDP4767955.1 prohibitin family protein [Schleiferiaceae bacterium]MDP4958847.1 prohibitin family protein [Schleiferiaceae bacterium]
MNNSFPKWLIPAFAAFLLILVFSSRLFVKIESGEAGVQYDLVKGLKVDRVYDQGLKIIAPWNRMFIYSTRIQEDRSVMEVLSANGLTIRAELSYRYRPFQDKIGYLHNEVGENYHERIIIPEIRSATREIIGKYLPEELYSSKRDSIQTEIFVLAAERIRGKYIELDAVLIRDVGLPDKLKQAIERKLEQEQVSLEYEFRLTRAQKEAERQRIEAEGKAVANRLLSQSLTDKILRDKGIDATLKLAESPNSKVIVVGGSDGLPLILGNN